MEESKPTVIREIMREQAERRAEKILSLEEKTLGKYGIIHSFESIESAHGQSARVSACQLSHTLIHRPFVHEIEWTMTNKYGATVTLRLQRKDAEVTC